MLKMFDLYRAAGTCRFLVLKRGMYCRKRSRRADEQREGVAMNTRQYKYEVVPYPKLRRVLEIMYPSVKRKPMIHGLLEVDVTRARAHLRDHKAKTGESLSFTAFIITCLARAVDESKSLHACRKGSKHLVLFDEVDVATAIEREVAGQKQPIVYISSCRWCSSESAGGPSAGCVGGIRRCRRNTVGRWASRQSGCSGKVPAGASRSTTIPLMLPWVA